MVLKRLGVLSVGKVLGGIYVVLGLIIGGLFTLLALGGIAVGSGSGSAWLRGDLRPRRPSSCFRCTARRLHRRRDSRGGSTGLVASMLGGIEMEFGYAAAPGHQAEAATPPPPRTP
ncbi:MAG: hypothetical protein U0575_02655 [Phycisphaerales bacterium]